MTIATFFNRNLKRAINASLAALALAASPALFAQGPNPQEPQLQMAPLNPAFVKWLEEEKARKERIAQGLPPDPMVFGQAAGPYAGRLGYIPDPYLPPPLPPSSHLTQIEAMVKSGLAYYSPTFDLRPLGLVSPVRNQNPYGTCWAFSSIAALESSLRKNGTYPGDLSEWHLAYFAYNPINGIPGFSKSAPEYGLHETFDQGGNFSRAAGILTRGAMAGGPVSAASAPYGNLGVLPTGSERTIATIQRTYYIDSASTDTIKGLLQEYGVVGISIQMETSATYYNPSNFSYRYVQSGDPTSNHAVNIVGWDDNFSKDKFPAGNRPSTDGAWIVRNSWGTDWHDAGYFYMSYDTSIVSIGVYVGEAGADANTYQYDLLGRVNYWGYSSVTGWFSNIFTASGNHSIKAIAFYTSEPGAIYEISIRKGVGATPTTGGTLVLDRQSGSLDAPGYNRIVLNSPVSVAAGERFAIIVKLTNPSYIYPAPVSYALSSWQTDDATAMPGVGFISSEGSSWWDVTNSDSTMSICLKAFADIDTTVHVDSVSLNKTSTTLMVGATETLTATVLPSNATNKAVNWSSSDTSVATVTSAGLVRGVAAGTATITATSAADGSKSASCSVTVNTVPVESVSLNKTSTTLTVGATETLTASVLPSNASNNAVNWSSSDTSVATVTSAGLVCGVAVGTATITATSAADGTKTASCAVTVTPVPVSSVSLNKTSTTLTVGATETLTATVLPSNATNKDVNWSSSDASVVTVTSAGLVRGVAIGTATITATSQADGTKSATCAVTVTPVPVSSVSLNKTSTTLSVGSHEQLVPTIQPSNATDQNVTWSSSNDSIATVNNGLVTGVAAGMATITVTTVDGSKTATCAITVSATNVAVTGISLNKTSTSLIVGGHEQLTPAIQPSYATNQNVTWSSSNNVVATVSSGLVVGVAAGTATITVTTVDGSKTATCTITVSEANVPVTGISLNKTSTSLIVGGHEQLTPAIQPSYATNQNVTWSSSNAAIATVSTGGLVTGVSPGTATITVKTEDGNKTATCTVTVTSTTVAVTGVSLNKTSTSLTVGGQEQLAPIIQPNNATNQNLTWSSSNAAIATLSTGGLVTGVSPGTATITVKTEDGNKTATCSVTVNPAVTVSVSPKNANLQPGGTEAFTATVTGSSNTAVTWSATGGTITTAGIYTAPSALGTYTIRATSQADTTKSDTATVTVNTASIVFANIPKALFVNENATLQATATGLPSSAVTWPALPTGHGTITSAGYYTAPAAPPSGDGRATITAASVSMPALSDFVKILIRSLEFAQFNSDNNKKTWPQLLDLANAFGSTAPADLSKYDINGDGIIDNEDLVMLFRAMGW